MLRIVLNVLILTSLIVGCQNEPHQLSESKVATPGERLASVEKNLESIRVTSSVLANNYKAFRVDTLRKRAKSSLADLDAVLDSQASTPEQVKQALVAKCEVLYLTAIHCPQEYEEALFEWAQQMSDEGRESEIRRLAAGNWLRYESAKPDVDFDEVLNAAIEFGKNYPAHETTVAVFTTIANRLVKVARFEEAKQVIQVARGIVADEQSLSPAVQFYAKRLRAKQKKIARDRADAKFRAMVKQLLRGQEAGYFVVYAEETTDDPQPRCSYMKLEGIDEVVAFARRAQRNHWRWKVEKAFPPTREGFRHATNHATSLRRRYTTIKFN